MITILEGTDGVGKSTAAIWLAEKGGQMIIHFGRPVPHGDPLEMYIGTLARYLLDGQVILDRSHFGSMIWARMGFHEPTMTPAIFRAVCRWHASQNAQASILVRPEADVAATLAARGEASEASLQAQRLYFQLVVHRGVLYHHLAIVASSVFHYDRINDGNEDHR